MTMNLVTNKVDHITVHSGHDFIARTGCSLKHKFVYAALQLVYDNIELKVERRIQATRVEVWRNYDLTSVGN